MIESPRLKSLLETGLKEGVFPHAAASVVDEGEIRFASVSCDSPVVTRDTLFDVASVTKAVVTSSIIYKSIERGLLSLNTQAGEILPRLRGTSWEETPTIQLMNHSSGLPPYRFFFMHFIRKGRKLTPSSGDRERLMKMVASLEPEYPPGSQSRYSDFGYIILGEMIREMYGYDIDTVWKDLFPDFPVIFKPPTEIRSSIPPTEILPYRGIVQGEVHDEHAFIMGGVSGHAGAFMSLETLSRFIQALIRNLREDLIFPLPLLREILSMKRNNSTWLPGWDTPSRPYSQGGRKIGKAIGHLGYTGCSVWIDLDRRKGVVLLTNRTFPSRFNRKIKGFRPWFHDIIWEENI